MSVPDAMICPDCGNKLRASPHAKFFCHFCGWWSLWAGNGGRQVR